jgi:hypothetical protein
MAGSKPEGGLAISVLGDLEIHLVKAVSCDQALELSHSTGLPDL